jgi:hypothetical protein
MYQSAAHATPARKRTSLCRVAFPGFGRSHWRLAIFDSFLKHQHRAYLFGSIIVQLDDVLRYPE